MSKKYDKAKEVPQGTCIQIYGRLVRQYALKYWIRLVLGVVAGIVMGGAMRAYLSLMDLGITTIESKKGDQVQESRQAPQRQNEVVRWFMEKVNKAPSSSAAGSAPSEPSSALSTSADGKAPGASGVGETAPEGKSSGLFKKINSVSGKLGFEVSQDEALSFPLVCLIIGVMLVFFVIKMLGEFTNKYFLRWIGARVVSDIRADLFQTFQHQSLSFFSRHDVGQIISRCTYDAGAIEHAFANCISELFIAPIQLLVALTFLMEKAVGIGLTKPALILIVAMPIFFIPIYLLSKLIKRYQHAVLGRISDLVGRMQENLSGIRVVKSFNMEEFEYSRFKKENEKYFGAVSKAILADIFMTPLMHSTAIAMGAAFLLICFHYHISLGTLAVIGYAAQNAYRPIKDLAQLNTNLQKCAAAAERIFQSLDYQDVLPSPALPVHVASFQDSIVFKDVTFSYENEERPIIQDLNLTIKKGQLVAVVGQTGSGKSTLANLLARFYDPQKGSVTIDGTDVRDMTNTNLRELIGIVAQDNFLFNDTIAYNIGYGTPDATPQQVQDAAVLANAHEFIMADPAGYQRPSGERGCLLSGGQKQRIAIARAILKNPPILILDEATSALDTATEQQVQKAITSLMKDRTVLAIAHRLSTIVNADKIILVDNGRIVEQGTHQELYALNGKYRNLYDLQVHPSA